MVDWYRLETTDVVTRLNTDIGRGLDQAEARRRSDQYGPNELEEHGLQSPWRILWDQFTGIMVIILIIAAAISALLGDYLDAGAILVIVMLNAMLGFTQEYRAEKAMAALKKMTVPIVKVHRAGHVREISARELVPGDIVILEAGTVVPADGRLLAGMNLQIDEATLTGESEPVEKRTDPLAGPNLAVGDRQNMVYMGTVVTYGRGEIAVTEIGMRTELGRIATMIQTVEREPTPLQRRLEQVGRGLAVVAAAIVTLVFFLGILRGEDWRLMLLTAISMAVAAVPEGLPAVVTIALAIGAQRMLKRRTLIRKLPAVESLGSVTYICSDKTGTLTENRMTVTILDVAGRTINVSHLLNGHEPSNATIAEAQVTAGAVVVNPDVEVAPAIEADPTLQLLLTGATLCNDAILEEDDGKDQFKTIGDPTEGALVTVSARLGLLKPELEYSFPREAEVPFTSERKRMTTLHRIAGDQTVPACWLSEPAGWTNVVYSKGAVDSLLEISSRLWIDGRVEALTPTRRQRICLSNETLAQNGMRVLGVAFKLMMATEAGDGNDQALESDLIFIGLTGMIDPPRPEVKEAVRSCRTAGIRPVMITGDHPLTAQYIARDLNIADNGWVMTGTEIEHKCVEELALAVEDIPVYARVSPEHKLKIVEALQNKGHIVAMTGDGINDAPALKKADIGVAMGITGTDVSKEAADMVLLDDNFATIVAAVEEGRVIYDNIRKFIKYTMTSNSGEIWVMLLAPFAGMPLPLLPLQILWVNLVTDGLPGLALAVEPAERGTMRRPPYHPQENIFGRGMAWHILWVGILMGLISLVVGFWAWNENRVTWQTMVFTTITLSQMGHALAIRSGRDSLFTIGLRSNMAMLGAVALTFVLQLAVIYLPFMQEIFKTVPLTPAELLISLVLSTIVFWAVEGEKWIIRRRER